MIFSLLLSLALAAAQPFEPGPDSCTAATAYRASVAEIARAPERLLGRCVTVSGPASSVSMFSSVEGIYLGQWPSVFDHSVGARYRIGLYSATERGRIADLSLGGPAHLTVTGILDTCGRMRGRIEAANPGPLPVMMGGYCHWFGGPVVRIASWTHDSSARYERLVGEAARRRVGDLVTATPRTPGFAVLRGFARDFADAVRRRDRAALAELHDLSPDTRHSDDRRMLDSLLDDPDSPFAELRRGIGATPALFVRRNASIERDQGVSGVICFCRTPDCRGRWPISILDAGNHPSRPYACTVVEPRDWRPRGAGLSTGLARAAWLREPARTAFRAVPNGSTR